MIRTNGLEDYYIIKNNKKLKFGFTTGSCAAAAAGAAARMLLTGQEVTEGKLLTPKGILLYLQIEDIQKKEGFVSCAVRKDAGDDPDATNGILIYASVEKNSGNNIVIDGGTGVGRVTKKGLEQPVGSAAINQVPRMMITKEVEQVCEEVDYEGGVNVIISIPKGEEIAKRTFNPRLGIMGGISVLGTSGIVEPMSEAALIKSIEVEMRMRVENGASYLLVTPGNYGAAYLKEHMQIDFDQNMKCSNYVGETIDMAMDMGVEGILFISHIGKFVKVAAGIMNTHSRCADARAEVMTASAIRAGASLTAAEEILETSTTDEALGIMKREGILEASMKVIMDKISFYLNHRSYGRMRMGAVLFSNEYGYLGQTEHVEELIGKLEYQKKSQENDYTKEK